MEIIDKRAAIEEITRSCESLDPTSRYIRELLELVDSSEDSCLRNRLIEAPRISRFVDQVTLSRLTLSQLIKLHLITPETYWMRFNKEEEIVLLKLLASTPERSTIISAPCSTGVELLSLFEMAKRAKSQNRINFIGIDINLEISSSIRVGRWPENIAYLDSNDKVIEGERSNRISAKEMQSIQFIEGDLLSPIPRVEHQTQLIILCRNFLGFFKDQFQIQILNNLLAVMRSGDKLLLDDFAVSSEKCYSAVQFIKSHGLSPSTEIKTLFEVR